MSQQQDNHGDAAASLWGRIRIEDMGTQVERTKPPSSNHSAPSTTEALNYRKQKELDESQTPTFKSASKIKKKGLLETASDLAAMASLRYRPSNREMHLAWEYILAYTHELLGDVPREVCLSATDEILYIIKNENIRDLDKKDALELSLGEPVTVDQFTQLLNLVRRITDYHKTSIKISNDSLLGQSAKEDVAVIFGESSSSESEGESPLLTETITDDDPEEESTAEDEKILDLDRLAFPKGAHTMTAKQIVLPEGTRKITLAKWEETLVPSAKPFQKDSDLEPLKAIKDLPDWIHSAFPPSFTHLNPIQTRVCSTALDTDDNFIVCAPTGAGKTNIALLAILRTIEKYIISERNAKIVYVAPMKALVQEMVTSFTQRLAPFNLLVAELTGDAQLTRSEISEASLIITTPEKWDVVTRKDYNGALSSVRLLIVDEVHLLHDSRGPVIESLILRHLEHENHEIRILALSATFPNYRDVATFMRAKKIFYFGPEYRPCPLALSFVGIRETKPLQRMHAMNEVVIQKVFERMIEDTGQVLIFVHSRKDTMKTARLIWEAAMSNNQIAVLTANSLTEITCTNESLSEALKFGVGFHHAGLGKDDRALVESAFAKGNIKVLVSTATLAWGVNLPAHTVIVKGTQVYSPERGQWVELSPQDMLQMLGRAGRPQFDVEGEGIVVTGSSEVQYYLALLSYQLPIESQMVSRLPDHLNAAIVLGVRSLDQAMSWISATYLAIRMHRSPEIYGLANQETSNSSEEKSRAVNARLKSLIYSALRILERGGLIRYERRTGQIQATELARIASHFYIPYQSMHEYAQRLRSTSGEVDILATFGASCEFRDLPVRAEERIELGRLAERVPIPVPQAGLGEASGDSKAILLLQSFVGRMAHTNLLADTLQVAQCAGRILRALHEMCVRRGWAKPARLSLDLCRMVERRQWRSMTPLRQIGPLAGLTDSPMFLEAIQRLERKDFSWDAVFDLDAAQLGELVRMPKAGPLLARALEQFPRIVSVENSAYFITRELLKIECSIEVSIQNQTALSAWVTIEDDDLLLYAECVRLYPGTTNVLIHVPIDGGSESRKSVLLARVTSDRWLGCERCGVINIRRMTLPEKRAPLDLPGPLVEFKTWLTQNNLPSHIFSAFLDKNYFQNKLLDSTILSALYKSGESIYAAGGDLFAHFDIVQLAVWRTLIERPDSAIIAVCTTHVQDTIESWRKVFEENGSASVVALGQEKDTKNCLVLVGNPIEWEKLSRKFQISPNKKHFLLNNLNLLIIDDVESQIDPNLETFVTRIRIFSAQSEAECPRIIAISRPVWNPKDLALWLGASIVFNCDLPHGQTRPEVVVQTGLNQHYPSMLLNLEKSAWSAATVDALSTGVIFVSEGSQNARNTCVSLCKYYSPIKTEFPLISDPLLRACVSCGIGFLDTSTSEADYFAVISMIQFGGENNNLMDNMNQKIHLKCLVIAKDVKLCRNFKVPNVVVLGTQSWHSVRRFYSHYPMQDIFRMLDVSTNSIHFLCHTTHRSMLAPVISSGVLPIESCLDEHLADSLLSEISNSHVVDRPSAVDYLTWTMFYRRLAHNPNRYGLFLPTTISAHLSQLVEGAVSDLIEAKFIEENADQILEPLNLGLIASHYGVQWQTVEMLALSLRPTSKIRAIVECIAAASEFDHIPVYPGDWALGIFSDFKTISESNSSSFRGGNKNSNQTPKPDSIRSLRDLLDLVPYRIKKLNTEDPHLKVNILLQAHFMGLDNILPYEQKGIIKTALKVARAAVDVAAVLGFLLPCLGAMECCQMLMQGVWDTDTPLKQAIRNEAALKLATESAETIYDIDGPLLKKMNILNGAEKRRIADFCNTYPAVQVHDRSLDKSTAMPEEELTFSVVLSRSAIDEDKESSNGLAIKVLSFSPHVEDSQYEGWWLVIGDPVQKSLLGIRRFTLPADGSSITVNVSFTAPAVTNVDKYSVRLYVVCDSYAGADLQYDDVTLSVV